ncbi:hypothetical protein [Streptomyces sp. NPDC054808]
MTAKPAVDLRASLAATAGGRTAAADAFAARGLLLIGSPRGSGARRHWTLIRYIGVVVEAAIPVGRRRPFEQMPTLVLPAAGR